MNPFRSIAFKLSLLTSLFVLGVIGLMAQRIFQATEETLVAEMRVRGEFFERSTREAVFPKVDPFALHFHVSELLKEKAVTYAAVMDEEGRFLSHSNPSLIGDKPSDALSARALATGQPLLQRRPEPGGGESFDLSMPIVVGAKRVGTARLGFSRSSVEEALAATKRRILLIAIAAVLASIFGTTLIVGWITRPLPWLASAAHEAGKGNFSVQVEWKSADEIGILARAFNEMTTANSILFTAIRQEKEKLSTAFEETREGIVWARGDGRILLMNRAARFLLDRQTRSADTLESVLAEFKSEPALKELLASKAKTIQCEFSRREPKPLVLSGGAVRLGAEEEPASFLFVFRDATLEKREETLARNFLSIVSHKLRTPLAVALGYAEMLGANAKSLDQFQAQAVSKIWSENEKLRGLVEKLLLFTTVQSPEAIKLVRVDNELAKIAAAALKPFAAPIKEGKVEVKWDQAAFAKLPRVGVDAQLIEKVLENIVDNAIKFNKGPRKEVVIEAALHGAEEVRVCVRDNGPGIPSEEHPKLFKKFYQVDQDFTGQIPGMGLGLAFVKNVVEAHGGKVGVLSRPEGGSEFFFTLPTAPANKA